MIITAVPASPEVHALGEGPVWDADRRRLLWVDIVAGAVHEGTLDGGTITPARRHDFGSTVGAVAVAAGGDLIVAERHTLTRLAPDGREGEEVLARLDGAGVTYLDTDLVLSNGLAWTGGRLYSVDTMPGVVWARDYDAATGGTGPRVKAFTIDDGLPDGMCADADGNLWIAIWGRGRVECRTTDGELLAVVETGATHTSCPVFAGPELDTLVITSATQDLAEPGPLDGRLFTAKVGVRGLPTPYWNPS
ncbi:SMP-30/gluconolactonase/LRE family protein [Nonomuraea wenchangensis]|uniref:SMP-30/gluconolactonase/LRE family protein n=1 Tax=Nonomuraea wenchangensis TaxID=568860 RepID=UPI003433C701